MSDLDAKRDATRAALRPIERRVLDLTDQRVEEAEIARRFRRSPGFIARVVELAQLPGRAAPSQSTTLRPVERRILGMRDEGVSRQEIGERFLRGPDFVEQVENLARYKLAAR